MSTSVDTISLTKTEIVVVKEDSSTVVVTGLLGPKTASSVTNSSDVSVENLADGSVLVYSSELNKWVATNKLEKQTVECGQY